jgi:hypothetical protein
MPWKIFSGGHNKYRAPDISIEDVAAGRALGNMEAAIHNSCSQALKIDVGR